MPSFSDITQKDWTRACMKLGLRIIIGKSGGKGSHMKVFVPRFNRPYIIQSDLNKLINQKIFKKLTQADFLEDDIWRALE